MKLQLITNGDSWTFGSEIIDPKVEADGLNDWHEKNNNYRISKIWPTYLAKLLDANCVNLAWPADDNGTILRRTIEYVNSEYIDKNISVENLLVIIGWSSPERNSFWYKDHEKSESFRLWPNNPHFSATPQEDFWKLYVSYFWNPEEYMRRYVYDVINFENFCIRNNIKYLQFNAFYQTPNKNIDSWQDLNIREELQTIEGSTWYPYHILDDNRMYKKANYTSLWNKVNSVNFYMKDQQNSTFKSYIDNKFADPYNKTWHPSAESHNAWATELYRYIKTHGIL